MSSTTVIRIGVVEDDPELLAFLSDVVRPHPDLEIAFAAPNAAQAMQALDGEPVDVLLVDLGLPDGSGIDLIAMATRCWPRCEVMVSTQFGDDASVIAAFEAGASGYLLKQQGASGLVDDIRMLHAGGSPISPLIARKVLHKLRPTGSAGAALVEASGTTGTSTQGSRGRLVDLSSRELEALELLAKGFTADEIARLMNVSRNTVLTYVRRTYRKLNVNSKAEAIFEARVEGLVR
jgi:DNA-binding NarL/FixJ family response regulator